MTDAWPVASGVALAASALALLPLVAVASMPALVLLVTLALLAYAGWAHALAKAAHGHKGALGALAAAPIILGIAAPAIHLGWRAPLAIVSALAALLALATVVPEWRRRKGPRREWAHVVGMAVLSGLFGGALALS